MEGIVKDFQNLVERSLTVQIGDEIYSTQKLHKVVNDLKPQTLEVETLTGFADYINSNVDKNSKDRLFIVVESHVEVSLYENLDRESMSRKKYITAALKHGSNIQFCQYYSNEDFLIKLKSMFVSTPDREFLLRFASKMSVDESIKTNDDGVSQSVAVNKGVSGAIKEMEVAPSIVTLAPYRTFREIAQPQSDFLFRVKAERGGLPSCALFESDGGIWKLQAMKDIADWMRKHVEGVTILS